MDWFNRVDATYRTDLRELNELNFARFDAKLEQRLAELDAKWGLRWDKLDAKLEQRLAELHAKLDGKIDRGGANDWRGPAGAPRLLIKGERWKREARAAERVSAMARLAIDIDRQRLAEFCARHHIRRLALFGSVLRHDFSPDSDVDVLVEFVPGRTPGFAFVAVQEKLSELIGRPVDLHTPGFLSPYFREQVEAEAEVLYAA